MSERRLLLDTCALIWLVSGHRDLSDTAREAIDRADLVHVSAISAWGVSLKVARDQLELPLPPRAWFDRALNRHNLATVSLTIDVLVSANELPWDHRDPADRFFIATAWQLGAAVVTQDRRFASYDITVEACQDFLPDQYFMVFARGE